MPPKKFRLFFLYFWYVIFKNPEIALRIYDKDWLRTPSGRIISHQKYNPWFNIPCSFPLRSALDGSSQLIYCPKCRCLVSDFIGELTPNEIDSVNRIIETANGEYHKLKNNRLP